MKQFWVTLILASWINLSERINDMASLLSRRFFSRTFTRLGSTRKTAAGYRMSSMASLPPLKPPLEVQMLPTRSDNYVYLFKNRHTGEAGVLDPSDAAPVLDAADKLGWALSVIVNTHFHEDHTRGNTEIRAATGSHVMGPRAEADKIVGGLDYELSDGDTVDVCGVEALVISTPGHTLGHIALYLECQGALFAGDTLFALGCGRLFEGTPSDMLDSLSKFNRFPDSTLVYCGHEYTLSNLDFALSIEPNNSVLQERAKKIQTLCAHGDPTIPTTLGDERATNPFLRCHLDEVKTAIGMQGCTDLEAFTEIRARKDVF